MARVFSAVALLPLVVGVVWFLPPFVTLVLLAIVAVLAFREYTSLASGFGASVFRGVTVIGTLAMVVAVPFDMSVVVLVCVGLVLSTASLASGRGGGKILLDIASSLFALVYLGLPLGTLAAIHVSVGREAILLLLATVMVSDTAQ